MCFIKSAFVGKINFIFSLQSLPRFPMVTVEFYYRRYFG